MSKNNKGKTTVYGSVEKLTQIGQVIGDVIIPSTPDAATLLKRGVQLIKARSYDAAIDALSQALKTEPTVADTHYYLAVALLKGRRPKVLNRAEAENISQYLQTACTLDDSRSHYYYLWALVKHDFYQLNGFGVKPPGVIELIEIGEQVVSDRKAIAEMRSLIASVIDNPIYDYIVEKIL